MNFFSYETVLWCVAQVLQLAVLVYMFRRRIQNHYPAFFYYVVVQVVSDPLLTLARNYRWDFTYYWGYWTTECLSVGLSFFVLQEIFEDAFRPFEALRDLSVILFRWAALVLLLVAGMSALSASGDASNRLDAVTRSIILVDRNVQVLLCGLVFFLLMFSEYLGISRRHVMFGVSIGFGFFSAIHMLVTMAVEHRTVLNRDALAAINTGAYVIACIVWLAYIAYPKTVLAENTVEARPKDWNEALEEARARMPAESLLDTMDKTVAQLLNHREHREHNVAVK